MLLNLFWHQYSCKSFKKIEAYYFSFRSSRTDSSSGAGYTLQNNNNKNLCRKYVEAWIGSWLYPHAVGSIYCVADIGEEPREARPPIRFALNLVSAAFTSVVLHRDVNSRANAAFIIFAPDFPLVRILFASYLPERNWNLNFVAKRRPVRPEKIFFKAFPTSYRRDQTNGTPLIWKSESATLLYFIIRYVKRRKV